MKTRAYVLVSGRVQGVWFRASTKEKAEQLGLNGWVKNTTNGDVEAVFEGEEPKVNEMIAWCHQGPPSAQVTKVKVSHESFSGEYKEFFVRYKSE